jgi:hypothetical protein
MYSFEETSFSEFGRIRDIGPAILALCSEWASTWTVPGASLLLEGYTVEPASGCYEKMWW